jgi:hypothetical protein
MDYSDAYINKSFKKWLEMKIKKSFGKKPKAPFTPGAFYKSWFSTLYCELFLGRLFPEAFYPHLPFSFVFPTLYSELWRWLR